MHDVHDESCSESATGCLNISDSTDCVYSGTAVAAPFFMLFGGERVIRLEHITKEFGTGEEQVHAVRDVSLEVADGEIFGVIGFSGAGKSTLIRCINLLERPTSGKVFIDDVELTALGEKALREKRKKIGMIFQHFNLLRSRTVLSNVRYPLRGSGLTRTEQDEKARRLLRLVDIEEKASSYPSELSGGQKQRVAIARALANDPDVLLCDEATSALDPQTTASILKLLKKLNEELGITIVVITHEMDVIKSICNRVAVMEKGRISEEGEVFSLFANPREDITKEFIRSTSSLQKVDELVKEHSPVVDLKPGELLWRLSYLEKNVSEPLISLVSRTFDISLNIILADVELVDGCPIGGTVAIVSGRSEDISRAIAFLEEKKVRVEVIEDARLA